MSLEIRFVDETGVERRASPQRDVAFFWPQIVSLAEKGLKEDCWEPWLVDLLSFYAVTEKDLLACLSCYYKFMELALDPNVQNPYKALEACGFFANSRAAQVAVMAKIGQIATGAFWDGIKKSTVAGSRPQAIADIVAQAAAIDSTLSRPYRPGLMRRLYVRLKGLGGAS